EPIERAADTSARRRETPVILQASDGTVERHDGERFPVEDPTHVAGGDLAPGGAVDDEAEALVEPEWGEDIDRARGGAEREHVERDDLEDPIALFQAPPRAHRELARHMRDDDIGR